MGNSAMDIAVEASYDARRHVPGGAPRRLGVPKYIFGRPLDPLAPSARVPFARPPARCGAMMRLIGRDLERYGLPKPDHRSARRTRRSPPTALPHRARRITPKPNIAG